MKLPMRKKHVSIRKFEFRDIPNKIRWINDPANNRYLHYDLPLEYEKTCAWFEKNQHRTDRYDAVIEQEGIPVGLIGLLGLKDGEGEYYISMGEAGAKGCGVAKAASELLLSYGFRKLGLKRIYLYTEEENLSAQRLFERLGFRQEGLYKDHLFYNGRYVNRYGYSMTRQEYLSERMTPVQELGMLGGNRLFMKREDMIPYSFGGNKARKARLFFAEIDGGDYDSVVTYGSSHSNHCRVVANMAAERNMPCYLIGPEKVSEETANSRLMILLGARITTVPVEQVHDTIENTLASLHEQGKKPYFIPGGGHGNIGTEAYHQCYDEICCYEEKNHLKFDYVFFASGTGTTHAGLVAGQLLRGDDRNIIGISIARRNPRGRDVVLESIREYLGAQNVEISEAELQENTVFLDDYIDSGYGKADDGVRDTLIRVFRNYGIPMDETYTAKAFWGMEQYCKEHNVTGKNILFLHTGGTPLFFDAI